MILIVITLNTIVIVVVVVVVVVVPLLLLIIIAIIRILINDNAERALGARPYEGGPRRVEDRLAYNIT